MENIGLCGSALKVLVYSNFLEGNLGIQILCGGRHHVKAGWYYSSATV